MSELDGVAVDPNSAELPVRARSLLIQGIVAAESEEGRLRYQARNPDAEGWWRAEATRQADGYQANGEALRWLLALIPVEAGTDANRR